MRHIGQMGRLAQQPDFPLGLDPARPAHDIRRFDLFPEKNAPAMSGNPLAFDRQGRLAQNRVRAFSTPGANPSI